MLSLNQRKARFVLTRGSCMNSLNIEKRRLGYSSFNIASAWLLETSSRRRNSISETVMKGSQREMTPDTPAIWASPLHRYPRRYTSSLAISSYGVNSRSCPTKITFGVIESCLTRQEIFVSGNLVEFSRKLRNYEWRFYGNGIYVELCIFQIIVHVPSQRTKIKGHQNDICSIVSYKGWAGGTWDSGTNVELFRLRC